MQTECPKCGASYDDADRSTVCPHALIMPADDLARKKAGLALLERDICFAHEPGGPIRRVQSVAWNGMITLHGMAGEFAPHLFVPATKAALREDVTHCIACDKPIVAGDKFYPDVDGGFLHAACTGPEREGYVGADGDPLKEGEPIPEPSIWTED